MRVGQFISDARPMKHPSRLVVFCVSGPIIACLANLVQIFVYDALVSGGGDLRNNIDVTPRLFHNMLSPAFAVIYIVCMIPSGLSGLAISAAQRRWQTSRPIGIAAAALGVLLMSIIPEAFAILACPMLVGAVIGVVSGSVAAWACWMISAGNGDAPAQAMRAPSPPSAKVATRSAVSSAGFGRRS
jgi:hypothetical protein